MFHRILVTTDFSECSLKAFPLALGLARASDATILLAHVDEFRFPPLIEYAGVQMQEMVAANTDRALLELERLRESELDGYKAVKRYCVRGIAADEIVALAREEQADLIVMATHGRGVVAHALLGSTAEKVVRHAPCPVLTVRDQDGKKSKAQSA